MSLRALLPVLGGVVVLLAGCAAPSTTPAFDARFGEAVRLNVAQQPADPDASRRNTQLQPANGKAMAGSFKRFSESHGYSTRDVIIPREGVVDATSGRVSEK